ncbi:peptidase inhibitor family I36 protein [Actinomadura sp. 9N215]|uniref:peptidase inhibitor family I36 protein n=1 Tax=Actinomadura sp. 9N215 TaxID=3375150 RepID=UPI0037971A29
MDDLPGQHRRNGATPRADENVRHRNPVASPASVHVTPDDVDMNNGENMSTIRIGLLAGAVAAGAAITIAPPAALASAPAASTCPKGDVCVWSGKNATGTRCTWDGDDPDWQDGAVRCRPYGFRVNSVWNNGDTANPYNKVSFYRYANYRGQISDPLPVTSAPVNAANLSIRSHHWSR